MPTLKSFIQCLVSRYSAGGSFCPGDYGNTRFSFGRIGGYISFSGVCNPVLLGSWGFPVKCSNKWFLRSSQASSEISLFRDWISSTEALFFFLHVPFLDFLPTLSCNAKVFSFQAVFFPRCSPVLAGYFPPIFGSTTGAWKDDDGIPG